MPLVAAFARKTPYGNAVRTFKVYAANGTCMSFWSHKQRFCRRSHALSVFHCVCHRIMGLLQMHRNTKTNYFYCNFIYLAIATTLWYCVLLKGDGKSYGKKK